VREPVRTVSGIVVRRPIEVKAVTGVNAYLNDLPLNSWRYGDPQQRMAAFLRAYKVGWFYKAGRKISEAIGNLDWSVSDGDVESEDPVETVIPRPDLDIPFEQLDPIEQLIRLLERPNPYQTGKALFTKTQIRRDFAGTAMWYLENGDGGGLPTAIIGISPARMWPSRDNGNLIGWVLDKDRPGGGVPFSADEIITFPMASADEDDECGVGVVESVFSELGLGDLMARHTTDLLTTGGRLAGMLSPKDRTLTPDEFDDAVKAWRNVASDPNAAKRLLLFREPMEYSAGASTPSEIGIPELANLNRDNILTAFPISPYQLGVPMPGGLNSGQLRREDRQDYWEGTIHPRAEALQDVIQVKLISRYERLMGRTFDFDFEEPNLDDAPALIEKVGAFKGLVSVGFDPKEAVAAVGLDQIKWLGLPAIMDPAQQLQAQQAAAQARADALTANAQGGESGDQSSTQVPVAKSAKVETKGESSLRRFLDDQRARLSDKVRESLPKTKAARKEAGDEWWDGPAEDAALRDALSGLYLEVGREGLQVVADKLGRFVLSPSVKRILADLLEYGGGRITNINERTRDAVKAQIAEGARRGYSIEQIVSGVEAEGYPGVQAALLDNGVPAFDPYRAELIARTETTLSFNRASIRGYGEFGVSQVQAIDGDGDEQCAARNGQTFPVEEALSIEDHPNGTLDWVPVL
jgi:phage portal protein BeeE